MTEDIQIKIASLLRHNSMLFFDLMPPRDIKRKIEIMEEIIKNTASIEELMIKYNIEGPITLEEIRRGKDEEIEMLELYKSRVTDD
jgi:hypothetical protein